MLQKAGEAHAGVGTLPSIIPSQSSAASSAMGGWQSLAERNRCCWLGSFSTASSCDVDGVKCFYVSELQHPVEVTAVQRSCETLLLLVLLLSLLLLLLGRFPHRVACPCRLIVMMAPSRPVDRHATSRASKVWEWNLGSVQIARPESQRSDSLTVISSEAASSRLLLLE